MTEDERDELLEAVGDVIVQQLDMLKKQIVKELAAGHQMTAGPKDAELRAMIAAKIEGRHTQQDDAELQRLGKTPYQKAVWKITHAPLTLKPDDIIAIKAVDPWLAKAAVQASKRARRWKEHLEWKSRQPVRLER